MSITTFDVARLAPNEAMREVAVLESGALDALGDPVLQSLTEQARCELGTAMAAISILYQDWQYLVAAIGVPVGISSRRTSLCGHVILQPDRVLSVLDTYGDTRFMNNPAVANAGARFYAGVSLMGAGGLPLGALCVFDPQPRTAFGLAEEARLREMGVRVERAIGQLSARVAA